MRRFYPEEQFKFPDLWRFRIDRFISFDVRQSDDATTYMKILMSQF